MRPIVKVDSVGFPESHFIALRASTVLDYSNWEETTCGGSAPLFLLSASYKLVRGTPEAGLVERASCLYLFHISNLTLSMGTAMKIDR